MGTPDWDVDKLVELVAALRARDRVAWDRFATEYTPYIVRLLYYRTFNVDDAEELAQQTFVQAWKRIDEVAEPEHFRTWLGRIAINLMLSKFRRRHEEAVDVATFRNLCAKSNDSDESVYDMPFDVERCKNCLLTLTPEHRRIIHARFWRKLSYELIAEELGVPVGTVRSRLHRALNVLCDAYVASYEIATDSVVAG